VVRTKKKANIHNKQQVISQSARSQPHPIRCHDYVTYILQKAKQHEAIGIQTKNKWNKSVSAVAATCPIRCHDCATYRLQKAKPHEATSIQTKNKWNEWNKQQVSQRCRSHIQSAATIVSLTICRRKPESRTA
jgi:hypothetical protein